MPKMASKHGYFEVLQENMTIDMDCLESPKIPMFFMFLQKGVYMLIVASVIFTIILIGFFVGFIVLQEIESWKLSKEDLWKDDDTIIK